MNAPLQRLKTLILCVCCLGENQFGSPPDKLMKTILEKRLKIFMVNSKIYPLNKVISHVKVFAPFYSGPSCSKRSNLLPLY